MASGASLAGVGFSLIAAATSVFGAAMSWRSLDAYRDATIYSERLHACTQALRTIDQIAEAVDTVQFAAENTTPDTANYSEASLALAVAIRPFFDSAGDLSLLGPLPLIESAHAVTQTLAPLSSAAVAHRPTDLPALMEKTRAAGEGLRVACTRTLRPERSGLPGAG